MTDVFGNYVIQKLFEHGLPRHRKLLAGVCPLPLSPRLLSNPPSQCGSFRWLVPKTLTRNRKPSICLLSFTFIFFSGGIVHVYARACCLFARTEDL